jgi:hypothetical protein
VEIAGREWAVGDRVIARRNDRRLDLDNGTRATITALDEHTGATVRLDSGAERQLDVDYMRHHTQHAYALTGHGMQGATVEWAGVIGQAQDYSRNWSYTALSRAREPVEVFLVDEPRHDQREREEIAPAGIEEREQTPLDRLARRMRDRDDEDLAFEQLERAESEQAQRQTTGDGRIPTRERRPAGPPPPGLAVEAVVSPIRERVYELDQRLRSISEQLKDPAIEDAKVAGQVRETIASVEQESARDGRPRGWRDRAAHQTRQRQRERQLALLRQEEALILQRTPDPQSTLQRAERLRVQQRTLIAEHLSLSDQAIDEELASRPPWLDRALGPEPVEPRLRDRWAKTARELAGHRIDHHVTHPYTAIDEGARALALRRALADTRTALGIDTTGHGSDVGLDRS